MTLTGDRTNKPKEYLSLGRDSICGRLGVCGLGVAASAILLTALSVPVLADEPTEATRAANRAVLESLPFGDRQDFEDAQRNLLRRPETLTIRDANGQVVWDLARPIHEATASCCSDGDVAVPD